MSLIDIGVNLTSDAFKADRDDVIARAREAGVETLIVTGTSVRESEKAEALSRDHPGVLYATTGVHPHGARAYNQETGATLRALADSPGVVAIGETGLDFNRDFSPRPAQETAFARQLELAAELGLPVFIHQRDAHDRLLAILAEYRDHLVDAVVHCFTDTRQALWDYLDMDLHIGITGWLCDERRGRELQQIVSDIPAERLMVETDAPYLAPRDLRPKPEKGRNEPAFLPHIAAAVAHHRGESVDVVSETTTANARRFFRL
ncbi:TatD family hydrolase [Aquisalimonas sp.]|uniref:TatD family hydrolase n=1 Tax=unclassified Aquisalimonas TaxID=2644645 RepID=UPI0025BD3AB7|nr:TatD family hydrolase [Aquisalimonas sp.]